MVIILFYLFEQLYCNLISLSGSKDHATWYITPQSRNMYHPLIDQGLTYWLPEALFNGHLPNLLKADQSEQYLPNHVQQTLANSQPNSRSMISSYLNILNSHYHLFIIKGAYQEVESSKSIGIQVITYNLIWALIFDL